MRNLIAFLATNYYQSDQIKDNLALRTECYEEMRNGLVRKTEQLNN
jgi:hypothetical protein